MVRKLTVLLLLVSQVSLGQVHSGAVPGAVSNAKNSFSSTPSKFIENRGQYGISYSGLENLGPIKYGYEEWGMPVLFTTKGMICLQRKVTDLSHRQERKLEKQGLPETAIEKMKNVTDRLITVEWLNSNPDAEIIAEGKSGEYHCYGTLKEKAFGFSKITYKNIYPGIDLVYDHGAGTARGFEYSLIVQPGADLGQVRMKLGGDLKRMAADEKGSLSAYTSIGGIQFSGPLGYYAGSTDKQAINGIRFLREGNNISFISADYDHSRTIVIDPFVTPTSNLPGLNAGKAKDVDFDYAGNIYVTGGGDGATTHSLAKYNAAGTLQWTFNGSLTIPSWTFGTYYGGWMVEKPTGNVYLGQGFNPYTGFQVVRINSAGLYDNFITTPDINFMEAWKMYWSCNSGSPQILVAGGGVNSNINFGVFTPPSTSINSLNVTGIPYTGSAGWAQDIVDFIIDPVSNDMYTLYASLYGNPSLTNQIYKNTAPYSSASIAWNVASGFTSVQEIQNRPYLVGSNIDNSANILAVNAAYLFYWDGKNLKAFNKATGAGVGTALVTANTKLMQGGIIADACNNIFVGDANGTIKVYKFNGAVFDDAAAPDISVPGYSGKSVYDLAYNEAQKLLYASGDGFVAAFDVSAYCPTTQYALNVNSNCLTATATVTVSPVPPPGSTITYVLYNGSTQLANNTTGIFTGLSPNITYTVVATINLPCSGAQATTSFVLPGPLVNTSQVDPTCGNNNGSITATASGSTPPYSYSIDGVNFQGSGTFTGLPGGVYTITVKDANQCQSTKVITLTNTNGPTVTVTTTNATCGNSTGSITVNASGGTPPYQYSIDGITFQSGNFFTGLTAGQYTVIVKDAAGCRNAKLVTIISSPALFLTATPATATCGSNNGSITAFGSGGTPPLLYSINGNTYQAGNLFTGITPGTYTVYVKDATGCITTTVVTVDNSPAPTVTASSTPAACGNINGTITASGSGGVAPLQYSINGITFQTANVFSGLAAGTYTITVKDATGCTNITMVTVASTGGPSVTASSTASGCAANTGTVTATASGGTPAYQYSINGGASYQASNLFTGLAPGNYIVMVKDALGCIGAITVTVAATAGPSLSAVSTPTSCGTNNGIITATASGGTPAYQYSIDGGVTYQASNIFPGLATGTYTIIVKDANNCTKSVTVTVNNVSGLSLTVSVINSSCSSNTGTITATAAGGVGALQYSLNGVTYQAGNVFTGLAAGTYTVYVKDANNCIVTKPAVINSVSGPSLNVTVTDATCASSNGVIIATGSGGLAPLKYSKDGGVTYQASGIFINLAPGTYTVVVKDSLNCTASQIVTIATSGAGPGISTFTVSVKNAYPCNGALGKITNPKVNGATCGACTFSLNFGPFIPNATQLFTNLNPGLYYVTAKDASGCTKTISVTVALAALSTASAVVTGAPCNSATGTIKLTGIGPNTPYHSSINGIGGPWVTFDPTYTYTGLLPGLYMIILADDESFDSGPPVTPGGCLDTIYVTVPTIGPAPAMTIVHDNGTCGLDNGTITIHATGGTAPYDYSIDNVNFGPDSVFTNLTAGIYTLTVMDQLGCIAIKKDTLINPPGPTANIITQPTSCALNNGSITVTGSSGVPPYGYSINGTSFQAGNIFTGLAAGIYQVYIKDSRNCFDIVPVLVDETALPVASGFSVPASCNNNDGIIIVSGTQGNPPYVFSINGTTYQSSGTFSGLAAGTYTVYIKDSRDCITTTGIAVANIGAPTFTNAVTDATCGNANGAITITASGGTAPYQYSRDGINFQGSNVFNALLPGTYVITVKDNNNCLATNTILVSNVNGPQELTADIMHASCGISNGIITATASGGTGLLEYSTDGITYQVSPVFTGVAAGTYTLYVRDANGCIKTLSVTVLNLAGPVLTASSTASSCGLSDGTITAQASGGTGILSYSIDGVNFQSGNVFTGLAPGNYTVIVFDENGCPDSAPVQVNGFSFTGLLAAATGGVQVCAAAPVAGGGTQYMDTFCNLIDKVVPLGAVPVNGNINNCVIIDGAVQTFNAEPYVQRHFDIEPDVNAASATAEITLYFRDQEFVEFNLHRAGFPPLPTVATGGNADPAKANLRVTQYHGVPIAPHNAGNPAPGYYSGNAGSGVLITPTAVNYNNTYNYWEVSFPVTGFSGFYVHTNIYYPLAVTLKYFNGLRQSGKHLLNWQATCNNTNGVVFTLERSSDGQTFATLHSITAASTECQQPFNYTDANPLAGLNYYRLKMLSSDEHVTYSNVVALLNSAKDFEIVEVVPNPVTDGRFKLNITSNRNAPVTLLITDMQGRRVSTQQAQVVTGMNSIPVNVTTMSSGTYTITAISDDARSRVMKFVKE